ncbi:DUF2012 domain-containing protein [Chloropicon roscoffensis]|uniref:DUF2012 domain-containing protein n=2 Tax=Chloropicon roscoffensis TaxID=1461544 RepID=A0AAX4PAJ1_9CHLO
MRKLSLLCGSPRRVLSIVVPLLLLFALSEAASDTSSVTFNGSVLMADGVVDPGTVKVYLTQRAEGGEVATRSAYLKVPPGFYKSFRKSSSSNLSGGPGQRQKPRQQGEFKFQFEDVPPGTHTLDVVAIGLAFPQYRVEVSEKGSDRIVVSMNTDPNKVLRNPVRVKALGMVSYFEKQSSFLSLKTLTKNPMYLIIGATALAAVILPRILDKDALEEMQQEMRKLEEVKNNKKEGAKQRITK